MDIIRIVRLVEYVGPRDLVEEQVAMSLQGKRLIHRVGGRELSIYATTLKGEGEFPQIIGQEAAQGDPV